jgi:hypothetical protein
MELDWGVACGVHTGFGSDSGLARCYDQASHFWRLFSRHRGRVNEHEKKCQRPVTAVYISRVVSGGLP